MTPVQLPKTLTLHLSIGVANRLKTSGLFDVLALPLDLRQLHDLHADPSRFVRVVHEMLEDRSMSLTEFEHMLTLDQVMSLLWEAFTREVIGFFQEPMRTLIATEVALVERNALDHADSLMVTIPACQYQTESSVPGDSSGGSPEASESIPDHSPCESSTTWPQVADVMSGCVTAISAP